MANYAPIWIPGIGYVKSNVQAFDPSQGQYNQTSDSTAFDANGQMYNRTLDSELADTPTGGYGAWTPVTSGQQDTPGFKNQSVTLDSKDALGRSVWGEYGGYENQNDLYSQLGAAKIDGNSIGDPIAFYDNANPLMKAKLPNPHTAAGLKQWQDTLYDPLYGYRVPTDVARMFNHENSSFGDKLAGIMPMALFAAITGGAGLAGLGADGAAAGGLAGDAFLPGALGADGGLASLGGLGASEFVTPEMISQAVANGTLTAEQGAGLTSAASSIGSGGTIQDLVSAYQNTLGQLPPGTTNLSSLGDLGGNAAGDAYLPGSLPSGAGDATMPGALGGSSAGNSLVTGAGTVPGDAYLPGALGSTLTPAESLAGATGAGYSWLDQLPSNVKSAVQKLLGTNGSGTTNIGTLGNIAAGGLDAYGIIQRNKDLKDIADRSWNAGAPSRARYEAGMSPDFDINNIPGYAQALQTSSDAFTRSLAAKNGNPVGNGGAQAETQKYLMGTLGIPAWQSYENLNSNAGGMSSLSSNANAAATNNATGASDLYNTLGKTVSNVTNPTSTVDELLAKLKQYGTGAATTSIFDALK